MTDDERSWEPEPISAEEFHQPEAAANINRAPHDRAAGVVYKRALNTKRVIYSPLNPALDMPEPWHGAGSTIVRWLFSEQPGTLEGLLRDRVFRFMQDVELLPDASTGQTTQADIDIVLYITEGCGMLTHRSTPGSPVIARPLRPCDAALVEAGTLYGIANRSETVSLRLILLGLGRVEPDGS